jgi:large subunit ribosomal protein L3
MVPVTLVEILPQKVLRYKTTDKDGYSAVVIGVNETETQKEKGQKLTYDTVTEFNVDDAFVSANEVGKVLDITLADGVASFAVKGFSKGKGYQGAIKRFHLQG